MNGSRSDFILVVPFCLHSFYEPIFLWCIEGTRFEKILTCFPYCCSVSVNFVFQFLPQLALASSKYQMLSAPCFLFVLFCILSFTSFSFLALHYLVYSQRCFSLHAKLHDAFSQWFIRLSSIKIWFYQTSWHLITTVKDLESWRFEC